MIAQHRGDPAECAEAMRPPIAVVGRVAPDPTSWEAACAPAHAWVYHALLPVLLQEPRVAVMDVSALSGARPDAHPSSHLPFEGHFNRTINDCGHWCLGIPDAVPDAWNAVLLTWLCPGIATS